MKTKFFKLLTFVFCAVLTFTALNTVNVAYADNTQNNSDNAKLIAKAPKKILNDFKNAFTAPTQKIESAVKKFFSYCIVFNIIFVGFRLLFGDHNFQQFCTELIKFIMICGVFFTVLLYLKDIPDVLASTTEIGLGETLENGSTLVKMEELIGEIAFLFTEWLDKVSIFDYDTILINGFLFLCAIVVLIAIMIQYVLLYLSTYFIVVCGTFALALGGISVNNELAMGYLRKLASIAIEFLALGLMMSITVGLVRNYVNDTQEYSVISMLSMSTDYFNNSANLLFFVIEILIIGVLTVSIPGKVASLIGGTGSNGSPIGALAVAGAVAGSYKKLTSTPIMGGEKGPTISSTLNAGVVKATSAVGSTIKAGFVGTGGAVKSVAKTGLNTLSEKIQKFSAKRNSEKITK